MHAVFALCSRVRVFDERCVRDVFACSRRLVALNAVRVVFACLRVLHVRDEVVVLWLRVRVLA